MSEVLHYFQDQTPSDHSEDLDLEVFSEEERELNPAPEQLNELDMELTDDLLDDCILELLSSRTCINNVYVIILILRRIAELLSEEETLIEIESPVTIVGDIHGQFDDLVRVLKMGEFSYDLELECFDLNDDAKFLFMGDYVDRGYFSVEVIMLLFCLKIKYPESVFLLRGNHEARDINLVYGFAEHCKYLFYSMDMWENFNKVFDLLPVAAVVDGKALAVHGGLSPSMRYLEDIKETNRFCYPLPRGLYDMLWADPTDEVSKFSPSYRGAGYIWGEAITTQFLKENNLELIIRAHELQMNGFSWQHNSQVLTIFSAPNYCYRMGNTAAILKIHEDFNLQVLPFSAV
eukprot:TRINITY_DN8_c1_g2_i5.p1 TRINITY_DN8_c1_g2~~TRINITY_DN8_c1_g2_i5.p1  ORF type:complete len:347 (+),score=70.65 TRINITY_DN8_c1_g2_i5:422-1462(+)